MSQELDKRKKTKALGKKISSRLKLFLPKKKKIQIEHSSQNQNEQASKTRDNRSIPTETLCIEI